MKKTILIVAIAFTAFDLHSQFKKGDSFFNVNGMYANTTTETGVNSNSLSVKGKYFNGGVSLSAIISNCLLIGAGLDYNNQKEIRNSNLLLLDNTFQAEEMNVNSSFLIPNIYVGYYYGITKGLYFNTNLKLRLGTNNTNVDGQQVFISSIFPSTDNTALTEISKNYKYEKKADYFSTSILPELTYFVTNKIGLTLGVGGLEYALTGWDTENSNFTLNFNPNNWQLGMKIQF